MSSWSTKTIGASCDSGSRRMREPVTTMSLDSPGSPAAAGAAGASAGGSVLCASAGVAARATASAIDALLAFSKVWNLLMIFPLSKR